MSIISIAITFFLVANPIGNFPAIIAIIKDFDYQTQKKIMIRESLFALCIAFFFQYFGEIFLNQLGINRETTVPMCGGILLLIVALNMIFPKRETTISQNQKEVPMIVPIATPLISGPALLTIIMLFSHEEPSNLKISLSILLAWIGIGSALILAPTMQRLLKDRGLLALEQLMGLVLSMMSMQMIVNGTENFIKSMP